MARPKEFDREAALDRAMHVFWEHGYAATAVPDLLAAMGIGRQSMYDTFGDKRALFLAALERYADRAADVHACLAGAPSIKRAIRELFEAIVDERPKEQRRGCLGIATTLELAPHDPEIAKLLAARQRALEEHLFRALCAARDTGELARGKDPRRLARFLVAALSGLRVAAATDPGSPALHDVVRVTLAVLD